jgi:prepilin signal peptidase PulO-like enzyme (type II secretory pathway)
LFWKIAIVSAMALILGFAGCGDWLTGHIGNMYCVLLLLLGVIRLLYIGLNAGNIINALGGLIVSGVPMLIIAVKCDGFGGGDVKLSGAGGFILGLCPSLLALLLSSAFFIAFWAIKHYKGKVHKRTYIPFGPFYAVAAVTAAIFCII